MTPNTELQGRGLLPFTTNEQIDLQKQQQQAKYEAEKAQQREPLLSLAQHIKNAWGAAYNAKATSDIDRRLIRCLRQTNGEYEPEKLSKIKAAGGGSEAYMMITGVKSRTCSSWIRDIMIPPGEKPWSLDPTPVPDLPEAEEVKIADVILQETVATMMREGVENVSVDQVAQRMDVIHDEITKEKFDRAKRTTNRFEKHIEDELLQGGYYKALSEFIDDLAIYPSAFLEGPIIKKKKQIVWTQDQQGEWVPAVEEVFVRCYRRVSPFDVYPSPGAKSLQDGYLCIRERYRRTDLMAMLGVEGFQENAVRGVLAEYGTGGLRNWLAIDQERADLENREHEWDDPDPPIDAVKYWGSAQGSKLLEWGMSADQIPDPDLDYQITAIQIGNWVVMARINPHPLGTRPYYSSSFQTQADSVWGKGPPELMSDIQDMCNAAARTIINNFSIASGPQVEANLDRLDPSENVNEIYPFKVWKSHEGEDPRGSRYALNFFQPDPLTEKLIKCYDYFFQQASEQTGIPAYIHGSESVRGAGETAAGLSMLMNAATKTLKDVVAHIDENVIKPSIKEHWTHLMLYDTEIPKIGDVHIIARASEHMVIAEQLQLRYNEFLDRTNNPVDMQIIGLPGRAQVLRESSKVLKMSDDIVPDKDEIMRRQFQGPGMAPPGGGPPQLEGPASVNPAGQVPGEQTRLNE